MSQLSVLISKIEELSKQIEQSAANHNYMLGSLHALKSIHDELTKHGHEIAEVASVVGDLVPEAKPITDLVSEFADNQR
jgi:hypothetical protein